MEDLGFLQLTLFIAFFAIVFLAMLFAARVCLKVFFPSNEKPINLSIEELGKIDENGH